MSPRSILLWPDKRLVQAAEPVDKITDEIRAIWEFGILQSLAQPQGMSRDEIFFEYARLEEALIYRRNRAWMDRILPALQEGPVVVAAGALHMPGEDGLLNLLAEEGFEVARVARLP